MAVFLLLFHFRWYSILQWSRFFLNKLREEAFSERYVFHSVLIIKSDIFSNCALKRFFFDKDDVITWAVGKDSLHRNLPSKSQCWGPWRPRREDTALMLDFLSALPPLVSAMKAEWKENRRRKLTAMCFHWKSAKMKEQLPKPLSDKALHIPDVFTGIF